MKPIFRAVLGLVLMTAGIARAETVTYTLDNVTLADGKKITGTFDWTYDPGDFEGGAGVFAALEIPYTTYSFADGNLTIEVQHDNIEISGNGDLHDVGLDIKLVLLHPFTPTQSAPLDLTMSFFECCGNGFKDQPFVAGSVAPCNLAEVASVLADTKEHFFWPAVPPATTYYAYQGTIPELYDHACAGESATPEFVFSLEPLPGESWYFLFSAAADCGEGKLGHGRPNESSCRP